MAGRAGISNYIYSAIFQALYACFSRIRSAIRSPQKVKPQTWKKIQN
jgi:hypothetical protein